MSRNQRIGLVVAALAVAVVAFIVAQPGDDKSSSPSAQTQAQNQSGGTGTQAKAPEPPVARITVKGGVLDSDRQTIRVAKNDVVRIVVSSDIPDQIHLHGYDIEKEATPGKPARFKFKADTEGAFELESHAAEDAGKEPLLARLLVGPS
ncbi:MAG: hypothetical protein QOD71_2651 [Thermoleophilaceae bacterium]|jgi:FtsP/CotA-like multicopper oxidase with cupredoxin domain|nr:hypothetical protein [Thermoleophilaceae bacterium]